MSFTYFNALSHVHTYSKFRPCPPSSLIMAIMDFLRKEMPEPWHQALDVGCGAGQSTSALAPFFNNVTGFDGSQEIIKEATLKNHEQNVVYSVSNAETLAVDSNSVELVTTAQSIHWFDTAKFYNEVSRILKKGGVLATYGYHLPELLSQNGNLATSFIVRKYYEDILKDYVLEGSRQVYLDNYRDEKFNKVPFVKGGEMIRMEDFLVEEEVKVSDVTGYVNSWSAFHNFVKHHGESAGEDLLRQFENELTTVAGKTANDLIHVRYRYFLLIGRKDV